MKEQASNDATNVSTRRTKRKVNEVDAASAGGSKKSKVPLKAPKTPTKPKTNNANRSINLPKKSSAASPKSKASRRSSGGVTKKSSTIVQSRKKVSLSQSIRRRSTTIDPSASVKTTPAATGEQRGHGSGSGRPPAMGSRVRCAKGRLRDEVAEEEEQQKRQEQEEVDDDDDEYVDANEDQLHEFENEDGEDEDTNKDENEDDDDDDVPVDVQEDHDVGTAPNLGLSDEEQDVLFKVPTTIDEDGCEEVNHRATDDYDSDDDSVPPSPGGPVDTEVASTNDTELLQTVNIGSAQLDESVLLTIVHELKQTILKQLGCSFAEVLNEIRSDRDNIKRLREHVTEMTAMLTTTARAIFIKQPSANSRMKEIQHKLCLLPALFNDQLMLKILPKVSIGFLATQIQEGLSNLALELKGVEFFSVLYFSRQPSEKKEKFNSEVGQIYSKFRYSLLLSSFLAMQNNSFHIFRNEGTEPLVLEPSNATVNEAVTVIPSVCAMTQPFWLKPGYVLSHHCVSAAKKQEKRSGSDNSDEPQSSGDVPQANVESESTDALDSSQSSAKPSVNRSGPLTQDEIATEASCMLYKIITSVLYRSRAASKVQLFHDVTYLFSGWSNNGAVVDQSTLTVNWESSLSRDVDYMNNLPKTKIIKPNERRSRQGQEVNQIDLDNIAHLQSVINDHPELSLVIQHDVLVEGASRTVRFRLSLIEVACRTLAAYVTLESAAKGKDSLCADRRCFKAILVLALGLKRIMTQAIDLLNSTNSFPWLHNSGTKGRRGRPKRSNAASSNSTEQLLLPQHKFEKVNGLSLGELLPAPSKQKELLNLLILNMTEEEYNSKMETIGRNGTTINNNFGMAVLGSNGVRIEADESNGVFEL